MQLYSMPHEVLLVVVTAMTRLGLLLLEGCTTAHRPDMQRNCKEQVGTAQFQGICSAISQTSPPQVRMKNTSRVRSVSRVRSDTPIMLCSAMEKGAWGIADAAMSANGAQCRG
jgi:hypothetical protein